MFLRNSISGGAHTKPVYVWPRIFFIFVVSLYLPSKYTYRPDFHTLMFLLKRGRLEKEIAKFRICMQFFSYLGIRVAKKKSSNHRASKKSIQVTPIPGECYCSQNTASILSTLLNETGWQLFLKYSFNIVYIVGWNRLTITFWLGASFAVLERLFAVLEDLSEARK